MAENNDVLGIQATINGSEIEKGASEFIQKLNQMESAADKAANSMSDAFQFLNSKILELSVSLQRNRGELEKTFAKMQSFTPTNSISDAAFTKLKDDYAKALGAQTDLESQLAAAKKEIEEVRKEYYQLVSDTQKPMGNGGVRTPSDEVKKLKEELKELGKAIKDNEKLYEAQAHKLSEYEERIERYQKAQASGVTRISTGMGKSELVEPALDKMINEYEALRQKQAAITQELDEQKLHQEELNNILESTSKKPITLQAQLRAVKAEMAALKQAGKENSSEFDSLREKAGEIKKELEGINATIAAEDESAGFKAVAEGVGALSGLMTAGVGVMSLFGAKEEDLAMIQTKLQSVMAITMGLQQAMNVLTDKSILKATLLGRAKLFLTTTTNTLRTSFVGLGMSATAASVAVTALYAACTLGLSLAIAGIVSAISAWTSKNKELEESEKKQTELLKQQEEARKRGAQSIVSTISAYKRLQTEWKDLNGSLDKQNKFIQDNQSEFQKLSISINNVNDAENLFVQNEQAFVDSLKHRAMAAAAMSELEDHYKVIVDKLVEQDTFKSTLKESGGSIETRQTAASLADEYIKKILVKKGVVKSTSSAQPYLNLIKEGNKDNKDLQATGFDFLEEWNAYYNLMIEQLSNAEVEDFMWSDEDVQRAQKRIETLTGIVQNEQKAMKNALESGNLQEWKKETSKAEKEQASELEERDKQDEEAERYLKEDKQKKEYEKLLAQYQGYFEKRKAIAKQYDVDRVNLIFGGASDEALAENAYQKEQALKEIDETFAKRNEEFNSWANSIVNLGIEQLREMLKLAEEELDKLEVANPNDPNIATARAKVNALKENIKKAESNTSEETGEDTKKSTKDWKELYEVLGDVKQQFSEIGDIIGGNAGAVLNLIGDISTFTASTISSIEAMSSASAKSMKAIEKASIILTILSGAIEILTKISNLIGNSYTQYLAYAEKINEVNKMTDAVNAYRMAIIEARHEEENWFSEDNLKRLKDYKEIQQQARKAYFDKLTEDQAIYQNEGGSGWLTNLWKPVTEFIDATFGKIYGFEINKDYKEGTTAAANNLRIETRKKSSGFLGTGIGGHSQKTADLQAWIDQNKHLFEGMNTNLFDELGFINTDLANVILDKYGDKLVGETGQTLEELVALKEKYDEYMQQLRDYVSSMYEPLVDNMVDALWTWLDEGKNALDSFKEYASDTFRDIVSDMMRTIILEKVVGSFSTDIADLYEQYASGKLTEEQLIQGVAKRTEGLADDYESNMPVLQEILKNVSDYLQAAGIDISGISTTSQEASARGFQTMSQDTGDELNGRFTALQIAGEEIKLQSQQQTALQTLISTDTSAIRSEIAVQSQYISEIVDIQYESVGYLSEISKNTKQLYQMNERLGKIEENTRNL